MFFFNFEELKYLDDVTIDTPEIDVPIEGAVNFKSHPMSEFKVRLSLGDLKLMVAILRDYVKSFDKLTEEGNCPINELEYVSYYRKKFLEMAERISTQIDYDYDKQMEKCLKKLAKGESKSTVGEDAMSLALNGK